MPTLIQITLDADGTINTAEINYEGGGTTGDYYPHCFDAPDGGSVDFVENTLSNDGTYVAWFSLQSVNSDFVSMVTLDIDVDVQSTGFSNDTCKLSARIFDADNDTSNPLTDQTTNLGAETDTTRIQRNVSFANFVGDKTTWDGAYIRFSWVYDKISGPDSGKIRLFGLDIDGTYSIGTEMFGKHMKSIPSLGQSIISGQFG